MAIRKGEVSATVTMTGQADAELAHAVTLQFTLYRGKVPYVDMQWSVTGKQADPWPEAGWTCLPFNFVQPRFRLGRVGSIIDPSKDIVPGANHDVFCLSSGLTVSGSGGGTAVGVVPLDSALVSLGRPGLYRYDKQWKDREAKVFVNLFNNIWGTNFQQWIEGSWSSRVRIWAQPESAATANAIAAVVLPLDRQRRLNRDAIRRSPPGNESPNAIMLRSVTSRKRETRTRPSGQWTGVRRQTGYSGRNSATTVHSAERVSWI